MPPKSPRPPLAFADENPKGRLLEFCMRAKLSPPRPEHVRAGHRRGVALALELGAKTIETGVHWADDEREAEQLAAQALLAELAASEEQSDDAGSEWVTDAEAECLRRENPKGKLLERLRLQRLEPSFDVRPLVTDRGPAFEVAAWVELPEGEVLGGDIRRAPTQKLAEQAAASSLFARLPTLVPVPKPLQSLKSPRRATTTLGLDPRVVLNNLRMDGKVLDYGFVLEATEGPQHALRFRMSAFAVRVSGERIQVEAILVTAKKEGERELAGRLLAALQ